MTTQEEGEKMNDCPCCGKTVDRSRSNGSRKRYCSDRCSRTYYRSVTQGIIPQQVTKGSTGAAAEMLVAANLLMDGWAVFRSVSPSAYCDLIAVRDGVTRHIEVRSTVSRRLDGSPAFSKLIRGPSTTEYAVVCGGQITFHPIESGTFA